MARIIPLTVVFMISMLLFGCTGTKQEVISGKDSRGHWNDADSRLVAKEMMQQVLSEDWLADFRHAENKAPVLIVGKVRDLSYEQINTDGFAADIERELLESNEIQLKTVSANHQEVEADFMMQGSINSIVDAISGEQTRFYQIDLVLVELGTNRKVWLGQKKLKKTVEKGSVRF